MSYYIRRKDAIRCVLRNDGEATVARIQDLPTIDLDEIKNEVIAVAASYCASHLDMCDECPICKEIADTFDRAKKGERRC